MRRPIVGLDSNYNYNYTFGSSVPHPCRREQEPSSGRNHCINGSNPSDLIRTLGARIDGGHDGEEARAVAQAKGNSEYFFGGC
jgi:hypothetical protein